MLLRLLVGVLIVVGVAKPALAQCVTSVEVPGAPIVTHWSNATQSYSFGATDPPPMTAPYPYSWGPAFLPEYNNYVASNYSINDVSETAAINRMTYFQTLTGVPFRLLNPIGDLLAKLQHAPGCVQIVHGLVVDNSFVSIMLPPNWNKFAPTGTYPILAQGMYDVNDNIFEGFGEAHLIAQQVAKSGVGGRTGAIGVVWNGGGALGSATVNDYARHQFAAIIDLVATFAGGDRNRVMMLGGSRGGTTALMMASNPDNYNYRVTYVIAWIPGTKSGTHFRLASATTPAQLGGAAGFSDGWRPGWTYPAYGRPSLVGLTAPAANTKIAVGTDNLSSADATFSPISDRFVAGLLAAGTQVVLQFGSHDEFVPFGTQVEYLFKLRQWGVPVEAYVVLRGGHAAIPNFVEVKFDLAVSSYTEPGASPAGRTATPWVGYYKVNRAGLFAEYIGDTTTVPNFPFTMEVPWKLYAGMPMLAMVTGQPGTSYSILPINQATNVPVALPFTGTIGANYLGEVYGDTSLLGGITLRYEVTITKPGSAPQIMDMTLVPGTAPRLLTTEVMPGPIPFITGGALWNILKNPYYLAPWSSTNWGISEY